MKKESIKKIKKKYKDEWLLFVNCETNKLTQPIKGVLIAHSKNRDEIYEKLNIAKTMGKGLCIEYSGKIPTKLAVMFFAG